MVSDAEIQRCPRCGASVARDSPAGWCTRCALEQTLGREEDGQSGEALFLGDIPSPGAKISTIGEYELGEVIGHGGMGVVYRARQQGLNRDVALKLLLGGACASEDFKRRFRHEAETAAKLQHPNIVQIYGVGEHEGQPYFSMEYVAGPDLAKLVRDKPPSVKRTVEYMRTLARAVAYAHQRGVLHRDLKPSNILLGPDGSLKVADFGLSRQMEGDPTLTASGAIMGTPGYMAPEQVEGRAGEITTAADVWSLGVIFYQLLTGKSPFQASTPLATAKQVLEAEPPRPSEVKRGLDRDLETICLKCLEKRPERRYETAAALAEDLEHWQRHEPIEARRASASERLVKWTRRHPIVAIGTGLVLLSAAGFATLIAINHQQLKRERDATIKARYEAEARLAETLLRESEALAANRRFREAKESVEQSRSISARMKAATLPAELNLLDIYRHSPPPLVTMTGHVGKVTCLAVSARRRRIISGGGDGTIRLWSFPLAREEFVQEAHPGGVTALAISPDEELLVSSGKDKKIKVWRIDGFALAKSMEHPAAEPCSLSASRQGGKLASATRGGTITIWRLPSLEWLQELRTGGDQVSQIALSPDGGQIVAASEDGGMITWNLDQPDKPRRYFPDTPCLCVAYPPDGMQMLGGDSKGSLYLLRRQPAATALSFRGTPPAVSAVTFCRYGERIVSGAIDGTICVWDVNEMSAPLLALSEHHGPVNALAALPDDRSVASGADDGTVRIWDVSPDEEVLTSDVQEDAISRAVFSPDELLVLSAGGDGHVKLWDAATGIMLSDLGEHMGTVCDAIFAPNGQRAISGGVDGTVRLWDLANAKQLRCFGVVSNAVTCLAFSPDGKFIITGEAPVSEQPDSAASGPAPEAFSIRVWDAATGQANCTVKGHRGGVFALTYSADGRAVLTGGGDGKLKLWDPASWKEIRSFDADPIRINSVAFANKGTACLSAGAGPTLKLWDALTGRELRSFGPLKDELLSVAASGDGGLLLATLRNDDMTVWGLATGRPLHTFLSGNYWSRSRVAFAPRKRMAVRTTSSSTIQLWDLDRGATFLSLGQALEEACAALGRNPSNPLALKALADWYQFRRVWDWAAELYEQARQNGASVPHLTLARCYWQAKRLERAEQEMALAGQQGEFPDYYLRLCRQAIQCQIERSGVPPSAGIHGRATNSSTEFVLQPGPLDSKDIWTTSLYSCEPVGGTPGGGRNDERLRVGGWGDWYYSLLQFNLSRCPTNAASATLWLYCYALREGGTPIYLDRITQDWDWRTRGTGRDRDRLWWADKPRFLQWRPAPLPIPVERQWYAVDITDLYNGWQQGTFPNFGLQLRPLLNINGKFDEFYSGDYPDDPTLRPKLVIVPAD